MTCSSKGPRGWAGVLALRNSRPPSFLQDLRALTEKMGRASPAFRRTASCTRARWALPSRKAQAIYLDPGRQKHNCGPSSKSNVSPRESKDEVPANFDVAITRTLTLIYTLSFLTILTRIQLNLLGQRSYLSSVVSLATPRRNDSTISLEDYNGGKAHNTGGDDFETNRNFLAFSWWLLHQGWRDIMEKVEAAVKEVFGPLNPREEITFERLSQLILETRMKVEGATEEERRYCHPSLPTSSHLT